MAEVDPIVREVADIIKGDLDRLTDDMTSMFIEVIPEFRHDDDVRRLMIASTASNLVAILDLLALSIRFADITVPPAAAEYARRFAQHGMSLEALVRAYRLGEHMFLQRAMGTLDGRVDSAEAALSTMQRIAALVNGYIDQVIEGVIDIYSTERQRWDARSDTNRAAQVRAVLETEDLDLTSAEQMLATSLRGWHQIIIVWTPADTGNAGRLLRVGTSLLAEMAGRTPLTIPVDDHTCGAWFATAGRPALDVERLDHELRAHPDLYLSVGAPATGLTGFRQTYRDAQAARAVTVATTGVRTRATPYTRVSLASLLVERLPEVRVWTARVLGELARPDSPTARLRETVRAYLEANGSYTDAAARMHVHKNTVHYRIRRAEELLGHPVGRRRLDLEVALLVCDQLGVPTPSS